MFRNHLSLCLLGISGYFLASFVAVEAVVNGYKAGPNEFPYEVSLQFQELGHVCGGAIIGEKYVLTAARCVTFKNNDLRDNSMTVVAGTIDLRNTKPGVIVAIERIFVPIEYDRLDSESLGDIAVLELKSSLGAWRRKNLKKLKLPKKDESFAGKRAKIAGFGWLKIDGKKAQDDREGLLEYAKTDILSNGQCQQRLPNKIISDKEICARLRNRDNSQPRITCDTDNGAPLVHDDQTIVGVLTADPNECYLNSDADVYTRVSDYLYFIERAKKNDRKDYNRIYRTVKLQS